MRQRIEVRSQAEFDACVKVGNVAIVIGCSVVAWDNSSVVARDNSSVEAWGNSSVVAWGNSSVVALGNSSVVARDNSSVEAMGNSSVVALENSSVVARGDSSVVAWENSSVVAWDNSSVEALGNSSVVAWDNSSVVAWDNSSVEARGNSSVEAWGNSSVVAWGNSFIRLFSALSIKVSAHVTIIKHNNTPIIEGGRQLKAAPEPKTGAEWCEFNGIDPDKVAYKVKNIDKAILELIEKSPQKFDMGSWHGDECDNENWCNTTHCRAGYAICLAGEEGFKLEKKYGAKLAGRMIYAVSRPNKELPDFFANNKDAMDDIKLCAKSE